ncbi:hypothetical protein LY76DRAFT_592288, partial [Colletotrichum caudatum]
IREEDNSKDAVGPPEVSMPATGFRRILPASTSPRVISSSDRPLRRARQAVPAACLECRKRKVKVMPRPCFPFKKEAES